MSRQRDAVLAPLVVQADALAQAQQAPVLARLVRGGAYHRQGLRQSRLAPIAQACAWLAIPVVLVAVLLIRSQQVQPATGVFILCIGIVLAAAALGIALVAGVEIWRSGATGVFRLVRAGFLAVLVLAYPAYLAVKALTLPVLNDVTSDVNDPPVFSTEARTLAARGGLRPADAPRSMRQAQVLAWPRLRTLVLDMEQEEAYATVLAAAKALKWQLTEESAPDDKRGRGRIEAVIYSRLLRLPQDVTIRLRWTGSVTRVDVRARSRVGRHDFGANAALIQKLFDEINTPGE